MEQDQQDTKNPPENNDNKQEETDVSTISEQSTVIEDEPKSAQTDETLVNKDPRYEKYFKMIHFGVPKQAVKLKMEQEGLDASVLE